MKKMLPRDWGSALRSRMALLGVAVILTLGGIGDSASVEAGFNPWSRAVGEADCLHDVTEDLRNRIARLFPGSYSARLACALDESACGLLEMVKCGADYVHIQVGLQNFDSLRFQLCHAIVQDCRVHRDKGIDRYLSMVDDRFGDLVADLSKCKIPAPTSPIRPSVGYPSVWNLPPQGHVLPRPYSSDTRVMPNPYNPSPNFGNEEPSRFWQGSNVPGGVFPRSTYDYEVPTQPGLYTRNLKTEPNDFLQQHPVAAEILTMLLQQAAAR